MNSIAFLLDVALLCVTISSQIKTSFGAIYGFGSSISGTPTTSDQKQEHDRVFLLPNFVTADGFVFAFSVVVDNPDPALIIVYRPQRNCSTDALKEVARISYHPSVPTGWRENVYLESFYVETCIPVNKFDMVGLYFPTKKSSIATRFQGPSTVFDSSRKCFDDGDLISSTDVVNGSPSKDVTFKTDVLPTIFQFEMFYYTGANCVRGNSIPSNRTVIVPPSTAIPNYKGVPGLKGSNGSKGEQGSTGNPGAIGKPGAQGLAGNTGNTGYSGPVGETGRKGPAGDTGAPGVKGPPGDKGQKGSTGVQGATGSAGEAGHPGQDKFVEDPQDINSLRGPPSYFESARAIWALFIWLAFTSCLALAIFAILVASGTALAKL